MVILIRKDVKLMMVFKAIEGKKTYVVGDQGEKPDEVLKAANKRFKTSLNRLEVKSYCLSGEYIYDTDLKDGHQVFGVTTKTRK